MKSVDKLIDLWWVFHDSKYMVGFCFNCIHGKPKCHYNESSCKSLGFTQSIKSQRKGAKTFQINLTKMNQGNKIHTGTHWDLCLTTSILTYWFLMVVERWHCISIHKRLYFPVWSHRWSFGTTITTVDCVLILCSTLKAMLWERL